MLLPASEKTHMVIEETAKFVARKGRSAEAGLRAKHASNPNFAFLLPNNPLNSYYRHVQELLAAGVCVSPASLPPPPPSIKVVIDKAAELSRKRGAEVMDRVRSKLFDSLFGFFDPRHEHHAYFKSQAGAPSSQTSASSLGLLGGYGSDSETETEVTSLCQLAVASMAPLAQRELAPPPPPPPSSPPPPPPPSPPSQQASLYKRIDVPEELELQKKRRLDRVRALLQKDAVG
jgi:hypothetical protein